MSLVLRRVTHEYTRGRPVVEDISVTLQPGVTALLACNGAGKTTLMQIASGALVPTSGTATVQGHDLYARRSREAALRRLAWMPQSTAAPRSVSAQELVTYVVWMRGASKQQAPRLASEALGRVQLTQYAHLPMRKLSGGMVRRVWLAQALAMPVDLMLLDEPSTGLDPKQRALMVKLLASEVSGTVLLSSHVLEDVAELAERVIVLEEGRIVFDGAPPSNLDAAWFDSVTEQGP